MNDHNTHIDDETALKTEHWSAENPPAATDHMDRIDGSDFSKGEFGFSISELLIAVAIIGILSVVVLGEFQNAIEKAKLSACLANMVTIREEVWANCDGGMDFPDNDQLWNGIFSGHGPTGYWYALDNDDPNKGHGNDLDGFDEQNPGKAPRTDRNIYFVLACRHDHGRLADYVFLEDVEPPQIAQEGGRPPVWYKFYRKDTAPG